MRDVTRSIYRFLQADSDLPSLLGTYVGAPSIFTSIPVPETATNPFVAISGSVSDTDEGTKNSQMRRVVVDVSAYSDADGNVDKIEEIGEHLRNILGNKIHTEAKLNIRNWHAAVVSTTGPIVNDVEDLYGRVVTVELLLHQKAN